MKNCWKPEEFMNSSSKVFSNRCFYNRNLGIVSIDRNLFSFVFILYNFTNILGICAFINCRKEWDSLWIFIHVYKVLLSYFPIILYCLFSQFIFLCSNFLFMFLFSTTHFPSLSSSSPSSSTSFFLKNNTLCLRKNVMVF